MVKTHNLSASELEGVVNAARVLGNVDTKYFSVPDPTSPKDRDNFGVGTIRQMAKDAIEVLPANEEILSYCETFAKYDLQEEEMHLSGRYRLLRETAGLPLGRGN